MLEVKNLHFRYSRQTPYVLRGTDLSLQDGEIGILLAKNGAGKSTLMANVLGILKPQRGSILFDGQDLLNMRARERAKLIAYVPQHIHFGALSVYDSVLMGRVSYFSLREGEGDRQAVERVLAEMGLEELADRNAEELSGGEKQKVAIARALVQEPRLLIFDEPTGNLDIANELLIIREAKKLAREKNISILSSIHDLNQALDFGDRFFFIKDGRIVSSGGKKAVVPEIIEEVFGVKMQLTEVNGRKILLNG